MFEIRKTETYSQWFCWPVVISARRLPISKLPCALQVIYRSAL